MLIHDAAGLSALCERLATAGCVALDTEFHTERCYHPRLMLVQVQPDDGPAYLVDALAVDLAPLGEVLSDRTLLVHGGVSDVQILGRVAGLRAGRVIDTQVAAALDGAPWPARLQDLVRRYLRSELPKAETLSDWSRRPLSPGQVAYAVDDVRVLPPLWSAIAAGLERRDRVAHANDATREVYARALAPASDADAWRTVGGAHRLDDTERAALAALAEWREGAARTRDVPRAQVASDGVLLDLARRRPPTLDAMKINRRIPRDLVAREGAALLGCIAAATTAPPPRPLRGYPGLWGDIARVAARAAEPEMAVSADLLCSDAFLEALHAGRPAEGWRAGVVMPSLSTFLSGRSALTLQGYFLDF